MGAAIWLYNTVKGWQPRAERTVFSLKFISLPPRWVYRLQLALLVIALSFLLLLNGSTNGLVDAGHQTGLAALVTAAALAWIIAGQCAPSPAGRAILVWVGVYLAAVIFSIDPRRSLSQMELMGIGLLLFLLSADLAARGWPRELLVKAVLIVGSLALSLSWLNAGLWYRAWLQAAPGNWLPDIVYRPGSANVVAMFMNLLILLAGGRVIASRSWGVRLGWGLLALAAGGMLVLTSSRGGWAGAAAGLAVLVGLGLRGGLIDIARSWRFLRARPLLLGLAGLILAGVGLAGGAFLYQRTIHPTHAPVAVARSEYWPPAWQAFLQHPLTGSGPFTYAGAFLGANSTPPKFLYIHAHGTPVNLLSEMGLLGAAGAVLLAGSVLAVLRRRLWRKMGDQVGLADRGVEIGAAAALAAVTVHSLVDGFHTEPIGLWGLAVAVGAALGQQDSARPGAAIRWSNAWSLLLAGALWAEAWMTAPLYNGAALANAGRWQEAAAAFDLAVRRDPASVIAYQQRALANSVLAQQGRPGALGQAVQDFQEVVSREPTWAMNHANLGALYLAQDRLPEARAAFEQALRRAPGCGVCAFNLGLAQEALGDPEATESYLLALELGQPGQAYLWRSSPLRQSVSQSWLSRQPASPEPRQDELVSMLAVSADLLGPYLALAEIRIAQGRMDEARSLLARGALAITFSPLERLEREWLLAEIAAREMDAAEAVRLGQAVYQHYRLQGIYGPGSMGQSQYAPLMFRRPAMALELAPQLTTISLSDEWGRRAMMLANWLERTGEAQSAGQIRQQVRQAIPDR